jgi:hypothetical protein
MIPVTDDPCCLAADRTRSSARLRPLLVQVDPDALLARMLPPTRRLVVLRVRTPKSASGHPMRVEAPLLPPIRAWCTRFSTLVIP